jgi:YD repeat-containing protein
MAHSRRRRSVVALGLSAIAIYGALVLAAALAATGAVTYSYDALGRVTALLYDTGVCLTYTYDANGNRTAQTIYAGGGGGLNPTWDTGVWGCFTWQ